MKVIRHKTATEFLERAQQMLDAGKHFRCLYADLANPSSNNIYRRVGYREICEVQHWVIE